VSATRTLMHRCWRRRVGIQNGGVYIYDNTREASKCSEQDRNLMRPFGFERLVTSGAAHPYVRWRFALRRSGQSSSGPSPSQPFDSR
jgi:hypothetical protein